MNPNLTYAEIVRGKSKVYSAGIIAGRNLNDVVDATGLIQRFICMEQRRSSRDSFLV
jgi:hypothetical protein